MFKYVNIFLFRLSRCCSASKDENDFRPLFENFLQDMLTTLNKPEWPAAEVLLTLLGKLLVCFCTSYKQIFLQKSFCLVDETLLALVLLLGEGREGVNFNLHVFRFCYTKPGALSS